MKQQVLLCKSVQNGEIKIRQKNGELKEQSFREKPIQLNTKMAPYT